MAKKILMICGDYAEDYEMMLPFQMMQLVGYEPVAAAPGKRSGESIRTAVHDFLGDMTYRETEGHLFLLNGTFDTLRPEDYAGLYLTGGRAPEYLRLDPRVLDMVRYFFRAGKPVAAICHGIQILTAADLVRGRRLTCYPAVGPEVTMAGGTYVQTENDGAIVDGQLATSPAWPGCAALMKAFIRLLETAQAS